MENSELAISSNIQDENAEASNTGNNEKQTMMIV